MGYELLGDVKTISLGGIDKTTGKKNPTEFEGYYLRTETRPNKFNPAKPQNLYVFKTSGGDVGLFGKAGIDREMKKARPGYMTKVINTEETLDVGKGNPMTLYEVYQDRSLSINVSEFNPSPTELSSEDDLVSEIEESDDEPVYVAPTPPKTPAAVPNSERRAQLQALLNKTRK